jgi:lipoyl(octanoyl) transferase
LNVNTDLSFFDLIVPCGIASKPVTSIQRELGRDVDATTVAESVARNCGLVFGRQIVWVETVDALLGNALGVPVKAPAELREVHGDKDLFLA